MFFLPFLEQVQVLVHIRAANGVVIAPPQYELFECDLDTTVLQIKQQVRKSNA